MLQAIIFIVCFVTLSVAFIIYITVHCKAENIPIELQQSNPFEHSARWKTIAHYFTVLSLLFYSIFSLNALLNELAYSGIRDLSKSISCDVLGKLSLSFYHTGNYTLYCVILSYWFHLYYGSEFYSKCIRYSFYFIWFLMIIRWIYALYFDIAFVEASIASSDVQRHCEDIDVQEFPHLFGFIEIILDIVLCALFVVIFWIPLQSILHYGPHSAATFDKQTVMLIPKLFMLVFVNIVSHLLILAVSVVFNMLWFIVLDIVINAVCMILMSITFHRYYRFVCACFVKYIEQKFHKKSSALYAGESKSSYIVDVELNEEYSDVTTESTRQLL